MAKLGRNEPCHCGSGRKYKNCCMEKDDVESRHQAALYLQPLLVDGETKGECDDLTLHSGGKQISVVRQRITKEDNHIHIMADGFDMQCYVLSRTEAGADKLQMPNYAAKGFTWYIRMTPRFGGGTIAFFKDVEMAMEAMDFLKVIEMEDHDMGVASETDLADIRRCLDSFGWPYLSSL